MRVEHEVDERALELRTHAGEKHEAALGQLHGALEIDDTERRAEVPVRDGLEVELARRAPRGDFHVVVLVGTDGHGRIGDVGGGEQQQPGVCIDDSKLRVEYRDALVDLAHHFLGRFGLGLFAVPHQCADHA